MFEFVNDPQFDGLPLVGEGHAAIAVRTECGRAARWLPGGDVLALARFLGETFVVVGADLYRREPDGGLRPVPLAWPLLVLVPPAGEPAMYGQEGFTGRWAQVIGDAPADAFDADLLADELSFVRSQSVLSAARVLELETEVAEWKANSDAAVQVAAAKITALEAELAARPVSVGGQVEAKDAAAAKAAAKKAAAAKEKSDVDKPGA